MKAWPKAAALAALTALAFPGCGQMKDRDEKIVYVKDSNSSAQSATGTDVWDQLKQFFELYLPASGGTREDYARLIAPFKDKLARYLAGTGFDINELIELLFKFDKNGNGKLTPDEAAEGLKSRIPILRYLPSNAAKFTQAELAESLARQYPDAIPASRDGLARILMRYDEPWAGGNGDGFISRAELVGIGLVLGVLEQTDFSKELSPPPGSSKLDALGVEQLRHKVNQQLFGRYGRLEYEQLPALDVRLEWMQFSTRMALAKLMAMKFGGDKGVIPEDKQAEAIGLFVPNVDATKLTALRKLYDHEVMGGNHDGNLAPLELALLASDLNYATKFLAATDGNFNPDALNRHFSRKYFLGDLLVLFPRTSQGLMFGDREAWEKDHWAVRPEYWSGIVALFDSPKYGGNGDGKLDAPELAMALAYARIMENMFALYDTNNDHMISKDEARVLFHDRGLTDENLLEGFFADLGLDGGDVSFWAKMKAFFAGKTDIKRLPPFEFYVRLVKVMPRILQ